MMLIKLHQILISKRLNYISFTPTEIQRERESERREREKKEREMGRRREREIKRERERDFHMYFRSTFNKFTKV